MIARLAFLTSPAPNVFILHFQVAAELGCDEHVQIEISKAHLANILIDGAHYALRESSHRVPSTDNTERAHEPDRRQQPA